jgi:hydrogenase nickel incorporation protein HypA/HybF
MHEYSIVQAMFDQIESVARANRAVAVRRVRIRVGRAAGVEIELLQRAYDVARTRTLCAEAPLDVEEAAVRWVCPVGHGDVAENALLRCATCGRAAHLEGGDEIVLERVDLEVA